MPTSSFLLVPISPGELLDKISILMIKAERMTDPVKLQNVQRELAALNEVRIHQIQETKELFGMFNELKSLNEALWEIEDHIRICERNQDFSQDFIDLARSVYLTNDERAAVKRRINEFLGSELIEEKSYSTETE